MIEKIIKPLKYILYLSLPAYLFSMFIYPWTQGNWEHVQMVWDRWQSLNVGVFALIASGIALYASHHYTNRQYERDSKQRERDYIAARAFLPEALSALCSYLRSCTILLLEAYRVNPTATQFENLPSHTFINEVPVLPSDHKEIFSRCIALAEPQIGDHLAEILKGLQINQSRISALPNEFSEQSHAIVMKSNILDYLHGAGKIQALINMTFDIARGGDHFDIQKLSLGNFIHAYNNLGIVQEIDELVEYTRKRLG